jgi:CAAX protease family protein
MGILRARTVSETRIHRNPAGKALEGSAAVDHHSVTRTLCSGNGIASALRAFGPPGIIAIAVIVAGSLVMTALGAVLVLAWARWSRTPWRELGYVRPRSWLRGAAVAFALGVAFKFLLKAIVMPLFGAPTINPRYHYLAGNTAALPGMVAAVIVSAGFAEETVYRGYLFERLGKLLGSGVAAKAAIVAISSALFAAAHFPDQGIAGTQQAAITGLAFGGVFAVTGEIWTLMVAHAAFDLAAVAIIYWNLEAKVAHFMLN